MRTAILVDGGFFLKRYRSLVGRDRAEDAATVAKDLFTWSLRHLDDKTVPNGRRELYRIFYYDCPPLMKKAHLPISKKAIDFSKTPEAQFRMKLYSALKRQRKMALRLGTLSGFSRWNLKPDAVHDLVAGKRTAAELTDEDFAYDIHQKGVDMKIGLDIARLAFKSLVDQIVLVAGDADFVPAAKLARTEGIDFVLDPMRMAISDALLEHIDGLRTTCPQSSSTPAT